MAPGDKCICQRDDWVNAFGEGTTICPIGARLTVRDRRLIGSLRFLSFAELPEDHFFLIDGFKPLRELN